MPFFKDTFEGDLVFTRQEGREINTTVIAVEFIANINDPHYKKYIEFLEEWKTNILNTDPEEYENTSYSDCYSKHVKTLKEDLQNTTPKITIKIELENIK